MTVQTQSNSVVSRGNGSTTVWPFDFRVDEESHLIVRRRVFATGVVDKTYTLGEITISGLGEPAGGSVTISPALASTYEVLIERIVPYRQDLDIQNQGGFLATTLEQQLDNIVMQMQQIAAGNDRAVTVPLGEGGVEVPGVTDRASGFFYWDADGNPTRVSGTPSEPADGAALAATAVELWTGTEAAKFTSPDTLFDAAAPVTLTDAATVAVNMAAGFNFNLTLGGNRTLGNPTNAKPGQGGRIRVAQDATGGRTLAYGSNWKHVTAIPTVPATASAVCLFAYFVNTSSIIELSYLGELI